MVKNKGKEFEQSIQDSAIEQGVFFYRIKDTFIPPTLRMRVKVTKNDFDSFMFQYPYLFALEMKATKSKSISFQESVIKQHQIDKLAEASKHEGIIAGFMFNFYCEKGTYNHVYFVHIRDFLIYKMIAEEGLEHTYQSKVNKSSIPIGICQEIGLEVKSVKKKVKYRYIMNTFVKEALEKYKNYK